MVFPQNNAGVLTLGGEDDLPTRHTVVVPFGMDEHLSHHDELFRSLLLVHVVLSKNNPVHVESGKEEEEKS